jgi:hypothetical protein
MSARGFAEYVHGRTGRSTDMSFWDIVWFIIISFAFVAYLMVLFSIVGDLFRDGDTSGWVKAVWIFCLIFLPFLTAIIYLIARGPGMAERSAQSYALAQQRQDAYIREVAATGGGAADEIAKAKGLLDSGAIDQAEFEALKAKALSKAG